MQQIASYVMDIQGSNPPNAKEPEGEFYDAAVEGEEEPTEVTTPVEDTTPVEADALPSEEEDALAANE
jgi:cytochrome c oxidase cbb3-type subunit 3